MSASLDPVRDTASDPLGEFADLLDGAAGHARQTAGSTGAITGNVRERLLARAAQSARQPGVHDSAQAACSGAIDRQRRARALYACQQLRITARGRAAARAVGRALGRLLLDLGHRAWRGAT